MNVFSKNDFHLSKEPILSFFSSFVVPKGSSLKVGRSVILTSAIGQLMNYSLSQITESTSKGHNVASGYWSSR